MPTPFDKLLTDLIRREGGFVHLPADKGGATRFGITQTTLAHWRGHAVTVDDVRNLTEVEAKEIYQSLYIIQPGLHRLPDPLCSLMVDFGVNSGPAVAIKALQEVVGATADGVLGPKTLAMVLSSDLRKVNNGVVKWRMLMVCRICRRDPSQIVFLSGWGSRILDFLV